MAEAEGDTVDDPVTSYLKAYHSCIFSMWLKPYPEVDADLVCNRTWDGLSCWPDVAAGTVAKMPCPVYLFGENDAHVYKFCDVTGHWHVGAEQNRTSSNYSECHALPKKDDNGESMQEYLTTIRIIYKIGYAMSLVALTIAMGIFLYFKKLWCPRNIIHMNLFLSFILRAIIVFVRDSIQDQSLALVAKHEELMKNIDIDHIFSGNFTIPSFSVNTVTTGCKLVHTLTQYLVACNYYWLLVEGVYLHTLITVAVFSEKAGVKWYIALGWGFPMLFVIPWIVVQATINDTGCWDAVYHSPYFWIIQGPVMLSTAVTFLLFLNIIRVLATKLIATNAAEAKKLRKLAKSTMVLIALFGLYYVITLVIPPQGNNKVEKFRLAWDLILPPFQGLAVAILYCFMNGEVKAEISKRWHVRQLTRDINASRTYRNGHSSTFTNLTRKDSPSAMVKDSPRNSPTVLKKNVGPEYMQMMVGNGSVDKGNIEYEDEIDVGVPAIDTNSNENTPKCGRVDGMDNSEGNKPKIDDVPNSTRKAQSPARTGRSNDYDNALKTNPNKSPKLKKEYNRDMTSEPECLIPLTRGNLSDPNKLSMESVV
uniref:Parathyroid hormone/parathyroid hormone-related peptide receptor-like n=1 Tax=Saccoglossus kowalevskii TaxID=10224 RepID=A0ABM0M3G6_SACKO|nr:PREDICTED: parathyroid hormone/parathyroid hormone-related peptide receptor-like [Saccoglossus kowalevskii]